MAAIHSGAEDRTTDSEDAEKSKENHEDHQPEGFREICKKWPRATLFIIGNEFCERFSYYGMRSVLTIYFIHFLRYGDNAATVLFHAFTVLAYTTPLFGSMIADGYIGKFWTIFILSIVYASGQITLAVASIFDHVSPFHPWLDFLGLFIIAIGTGGIKPCVSSFGGDQFNPAHTRMISIFFSAFYFTINAGSTLSMFITPLFRSLSCLGQTSCYPLAFGIPAVLMLIATGLFMVGSFWYKRYPPTENVILKVINTIRSALRNRKRAEEKRGHWLEHALDDHDCVSDERCMEHPAICAQESFVRDVQSLVRVVVMMLPFPMFWALYDQQGSRWTIQAMQMNSHVIGGFYLLPDQMQVLNAVLILVFIPVFQAFIYPSLERLGIRVTMLRKMAAGGLLAAASFVLCALVQFAVQGSVVPTIQPNTAHITFLNLYDNSTCLFTPSSSVWKDRAIGTSKLFDARTDVYTLPTSPSVPSFYIRGEGANCPVNVPLPLEIAPLSSSALFLTPDGYSFAPSPTNKPQNVEEIGISVILDLPCAFLREQTDWIDCDHFYNGSLALCKGETCQWAVEKATHIWNEADETFPIVPYRGALSTRSIVRYAKVDVVPEKYSVHLINRVDGRIVNDWKIPSASLSFHEMGSVITAIMNESGLVALHRSVAPNSVSILWQFPQYFILTAAEVLFSVTGLEFAYSEAAPSLKSVVTALYLLTVAFGDLIIIAIAQLNMFSDMTTEMLSFAFAMLLTIGVFILLSIYYYEYAHYDKDEEEEKKD